MSRDFGEVDCNFVNRPAHKLWSAANNGSDPRSSVPLPNLEDPESVLESRPKHVLQHCDRAHCADLTEPTSLWKAILRQAFYCLVQRMDLFVHK
jgi:hypothetical protein